MPTNISYRPEIYLGNSLDAEQLNAYKEQLEQKPFFSGLFLVALSQNPRDQLEIIDARMLLQDYFKHLSMKVIGLAGSKGEAFDLTVTILNDCLQARGDCSMREFLEWSP